MIILDISSKNHQIIVVSIALASKFAVVIKINIQFDCIITDYFIKDKLTEVLITLFYPNRSCFINQTTTVKYESSIFFSDILTFIEDKLYLELYNFNFYIVNNLLLYQHLGTRTAKARAQTNHVILRFHNNHMPIGLTIQKIHFFTHNILVIKA